MDTWLKTLNVGTCITVLTAVGWWGWSEWRAAQPRRVLMADPAEVEEVLSGLPEWQDECQVLVDAWDNGERPDATNQIGTAAADKVERCRSIMEMRPHAWAMD